MIKKEEILKDTPEYEPYDANGVELSKSELVELGILSCGGCSLGKSCNKDCGENDCCKNKKTGITIIKK